MIPTPFIRRKALSFVGSALLGALLIAGCSGDKTAGGPPKMGPMPVTVIEMQPQKVPTSIEIMISRCEYVDEFASVQEEVGRPAQSFLAKIERVYQQAAAKGTLRAGLDPLATARDTWAFTSGLLHLLLSCQKGTDLSRHVPAMIAAHMAMRRAG